MAAKQTIYVQYMGDEITTDEIMKKIKEYWTKELKKKVSEMKNVTVYVKPEEGKAYYVINDEITAGKQCQENHTVQMSQNIRAFISYSQYSQACQQQCANHG